MTAEVEGTWKNFIFKFIEPADIPKIYDHLRNSFYRDEPVSQLLGYSEDFAKDFEKLYDAIFCFGDRLSFIAVDNTNGKVRLLPFHKSSPEDDYGG